MDLKAKLNTAIAHHQAGRLSEAAALYGDIANGKPGIGNDAKYYSDAIHNLGLVLAAQGRIDDALVMLDRSIGLRPREPRFHTNLAATLVNAARPADAERAYLASKRASEYAPADALALELFATAATKAGHEVEAIPAWQRLAMAKPNDATIQFNIGVCCQKAAQNYTAVAAYREAMRLRPGYVEAMSNLALLLGLLDERREAFELISQLHRANQVVSALKPLYASLLVNSGFITQGQTLLDEIEQHRDAERDRPNGIYQDILSRRFVCSAQSDAGNMVESFRLCEELCNDYPGDATLRTHHVVTSQYLYPDDPAAHLERHRLFERDVASKITPLPPVPMRPLEGRRLRIGYVSDDLYAHPVGYFFEPLLLNHDSSRVEIHCFSTTKIVDATTERMKAKADRWHDLYTMSDRGRAAQIRAAEIDVLIDLTGHSGISPLMAFAYRPAPLQLTYLGYSSTTGLAAMDGLITDAIADPPGESDAHFTERLLRLPHVFAVFRPPAGAPDVGPPPFRKAGHVMLGAVATIRKINDAVLDAWAAGLRAAPSATLMMVGKGYHEGFVQQRLRDRFAARGVDPARLFFSTTLSMHDYLALHAQIDLMLDTFPFTGHTTTVQNLWMGVPVATYAGRSHRSRMSASVLTSIGLTDFIAHHEADFGPLIARWANDPEGLARVRSALRDRMTHSPLMDEQAFARDFEDLVLKAYETKRETGHL